MLPWSWVDVLVEGIFLIVLEHCVGESFKWASVPMCSLMSGYCMLPFEHVHDLLFSR